ncbi:MAG: UbiX family flavin prenyltransferase [Desulfurococcales archaeon]|nr:UbiX family flavin prenyltransferase [Desulfurococcales archaeon]
MSSRKVALAITGASAVRIGIRVAEYLSSAGYELHIVATRGAEEVAIHEEGLRRGELIRLLERYGIVYREDDYNSPLASSSSVPRTMLVVPASMKTVALAANGIQSNLVIRAMLAVLRIGGRLVVAPRETPVGVVELRNMFELARMGALIVPLCVAFYHKPETLNDIVDFLAGKILDAAGIENDLYRRWAQK